MKTLRIIDWNISYTGKANEKLEFLNEIMGDGDCIVMLQEVTLDTYEIIREYFGQRLNMEYSLDYRPPGKFDTKSRKLGVAICSTPGMEIVSADVIKRSLFPDRTLKATVKYKDNYIKVMTLHSITGCQHKKAKSIQFFSFAEAVDEFHPDILGMDANEPKVDSLNFEDLVFFDNHDKGKGAKTFFNTIRKNGLVDAYRQTCELNKSKYENCLEVSHKINGKVARRYDYIFMKGYRFKETGCKYLYDEGIEAGGDHAIIVVDTEV